MSSNIKEYDKAIANGPTFDRHAGLFSKFVIEFKHLVSGTTVFFPAIITAYNDNWSSSWNEETYYGRMDPVVKFQNTARKITFSFAVVNDDPSQSAENLAKFQKLTQMLYPGYDSSSDENQINPYQHAATSTVNSAPILGLKLANLIQNTGKGSDWLMGFMDGFTFQPDMALGFWTADGIDNQGLSAQQIKKGDFKGSWEWVPDPSSPATATVEKPTLLPKKWDVGGTFTVLHTHPLGWSEDGSTFLGGDYPFKSEDMTAAMPTHLQEKVEVASRATIAEAKVPKSVKKGLWDKLLKP